VLVASPPQSSAPSKLDMAIVVPSLAVIIVGAFPAEMMHSLRGVKVHEVMRSLVPWHCSKERD